MSTSQTESTMRKQTPPPWLFVGLVLGGALFAMIPLAGFGLAALAAAGLFFLLAPVDYRFATFCLVGAFFINASRVYAPTEYVLLTFDLLLYMGAAIACFNRLFLTEVDENDWSAPLFSLPIILAAAFLAISLLEIFNPNVPDMQFALKGLRKTAFSIVGFFAGAWLFQNRRQFDQAWKVMLIAGVPLILYGIKQSVHLSAFDYKLLAQNAADYYTLHLQGSQYRAFSIFSGPFHLGMFSCAIALMALYFMNRGRARLCAILYVLTFVAMLVTQTRTNLVTFIAVSWLFMVLTAEHPLKWIRNTLILVALLCGLIVIAWFAQPERFDRLLTSFSRLKQDERLLRRFDYYPLIWDAITKKPIAGYGMGSGGDTLEVGPGGVHYTTHNLFFKIMLETGVFGAVSFFGLILYGLLLYAGIKFRQWLAPDLHRLAALHLCIVMIVLINGLVGSAIEAYPVNLVFWFALGGLIVLGREMRSLIAGETTVEATEEPAT